jgi:hypothetical protein
MAPLFPLGRVLATPGAIALMEAARIDPACWSAISPVTGATSVRRTGARTTSPWTGGYRTFSAYGQPPDLLWALGDARHARAFLFVARTLAPPRPRRLPLACRD